MNAKTLITTQGLLSGSELLLITALTLALQENSFSSYYISALMISHFLPAAFLGKHLYPAVSHLNESKILKLTWACKIICLLLLLLFSSVPWVIVSLFLIYCIFSVLENPLLYSLVPLATRTQEDTKSLYAKLSTSSNIGGILGAPLGAALFAISSSIAFPLLSCITLFAAVALLWTLKIPKTVTANTTALSPQTTETKTTTKKAELHSSLKAPIYTLMAAIVFTSLLPIARIDALIEDWKLTPQAVGFSVAAYSVGRLLYAVHQSARPNASLRSTTQLFLSTLILGCSLSLFFILDLTYSLKLPLAFFCFAIAGAANTGQVLSLRSIAVEHVPSQDLAGNFVAVAAHNNLASLVGFTLAAPTVFYLGGIASLSWAGFLTIISSLVGFLLFRRKTF